MRCAACGADIRSDEFAPEGGTIAPARDRPLLCPSCNEAAQQSIFGHERASPPVQTAPMHAAPPLSVSSESADELDECEVLLRRAIEVVRAAVHRPRPASDTSDRASDASVGLADPRPLDRAPSASVPSIAERDLDECELLLGRAIAMVRGPTRRTRPNRGLTDAGPAVPTERTGSVRTERLPVRRAVAIQHDARGGYVAVDAKTGLSLLRNQDAKQLSVMCGRIGWQVIGDERPRAGD